MASKTTPSSFSSDNTRETSSKSKDDRLNEILTCGICLSRMSSPCCLPCAHSCCRSCLLDYAYDNNINTSTSINSILCPYCKFQLNFRSFEHLESLLIINPTLKQLCEVLDTSNINARQSSARCHTCCLLQMLKVCKHCFFMLCETCRRTHLLDVHRESQIQLDLLHSHLGLVNKKRLQMEKITREYDDMRGHIQKYADRLISKIEEQQRHAFQILDERQRTNIEAFWKGNGFDNDEKLDYFVSLVETGQRKLSAKNITDRDLMDLADNLQTMPDINEESIESIDFAQLTLELNETFPMIQLICLYDNDLSARTTNVSEQLINDNEQTDSIQT